MKADGSLVVTLLECNSEFGGEGLIRDLTFSFFEMKHWSNRPEGLVVVFEHGRTCFPWHRVWSYEVINNSLEYVKWCQEHRKEEPKYNRHKCDDCQHTLVPEHPYCPATKEN